MDLKKIQAGTGVIFFVFVLLHLLNTYVAAFGPAAYNTTQQALRIVYQFPPVEALLLAALLVHIVVGLVRLKVEPKRTLTTRARWHRYAGVFLLIVIGGHIAAVRGPSWLLDIYPGFHGLAFSVAAVPAYFFPYYFLLALAGFYHAFNGVGIAASRLGFAAKVSNRTLTTVTAVAAGLGLLTLLALAGTWHELGDLYAGEFAQLALEIVGESAP